MCVAVPPGVLFRKSLGDGGCPKYTHIAGRLLIL